MSKLDVKQVMTGIGFMLGNLYAQLDEEGKWQMREQLNEIINLWNMLDEGTITLQDGVRNILAPKEAK